MAPATTMAIMKKTTREGFLIDHSERLKPFTVPLQAGLNDLQAATMWFMQNAFSKPDNAGAGDVHQLGPTGLAVLAAVWALAAVGIVSKTVLKLRSDAVSIPFYLLMGWLIVPVLRPFAGLVHPNGLALLVAGGACYSLGIGFFLSRRAYAHAVWHVFVLAGVVCHFVVVSSITLPG